MSNNFFKFKQFTVYHDRCAMKVGTDGVLLGAWTPLYNPKQILDVGTGSGLIALQLAQRCKDAFVTAIEIDPEAARQAKENVNASLWRDRMEVVCCDFKIYRPDKKFDLIVSNPPYFVDALKCPDAQRNTARHTDTCSLNYDLLFRQSVHLLWEQGVVSLVIPSEVEEDVLNSAFRHGFYPHKRLRVFTKPGKPCRRVLLAFGLQYAACKEEELCIEYAHHEYTADYINLTKFFYLNMPDD